MTHQPYHGDPEYLNHANDEVPKLEKEQAIADAHNAKTVPFYPAKAALAVITRTGFSLVVTPVQCFSSVEQAGYNAFQDGFLVLDALYFGDRYQKDDSDDAWMLAEWLVGFWKAHGEETARLHRADA